NCAECEGRILKHTEETISNSLKEINLEYISGFKTTLDYFKYRCECGNEDRGLYHMLLKGNRCGNCLERKHWTYEKVRVAFEKEGCTLLEVEYINNKTPLRFKCKCKEIGEKPLMNFLKTPYCFECGNKNKARGERHSFWNPNLTDEERMEKRKHPIYKTWRIQVFKRDNYTCQCCGDNKGGNLNAHHLNSHDWDIEGRVDPDNGITLCSLCHTDFHLLYGYGNNTKEQYQEYIEELYENLAI